LIIEALGGTRPIYAHLPLVLAPDKSKLSKRKHGESVSIKYYKDRDYEPIAIVNFLALIGWNPGTDQEVFTLDELINSFDLEKVQKKGGVFDVARLDWINKEHILRQSEELKIENLKLQIGKTKHKDNPKFADEMFFKKFFDMIIERIHRWGEVSEWLEAGEYDYLFEKPAYEKGLLIWKKSDAEKTKSHLQKISEIIALSGDIKSVWDQIFKYAEEQGKGDVLWPLRTALSGRRESPDPRTLLDLLGTEESLARVRQASEML
jgi:glutamyl/glutaminyl-tRNA synthetase